MRREGGRTESREGERRKLAAAVRFLPICDRSHPVIYDWELRAAGENSLYLAGWLADFPL